MSPAMIIKIVLLYYSYYLYTIDTVLPDSPVVWFPVLSGARQYKGITCNARGAPSHRVFGYGSAHHHIVPLYRI